MITFFDRTAVNAPPNSVRLSDIYETRGNNGIILQLHTESVVGEASPGFFLDTTQDPALEDWIVVGSALSAGVNNRPNLGRFIRIRIVNNAGAEGWQDSFSYAVGEIVESSGLWECTTAHTSDLDNEPGGNQGTADAWGAGTPYTVSDLRIVSLQGVIDALKVHTKAGSKKMPFADSVQRLDHRHARKAADSAK